MARFDTLFKKFVKTTDYKVNPNKSLVWNETNLRRMAYYEHSCRALYEKLDSTFGEEYAEHILTNVLKENFVVTNFGKFTFKEFDCISERVLMVEYLNHSPLKSDGNIAAHTLISFYTSVIRDIISVTKHAGSIELYDFFICFSLMLEKWRITEYPKYITKRLADVETLLQQFAKLVVNALFCKEGDSQTITLAILDRHHFDECVTGGNYSVVIDKNTGERLEANYDIYIKGLKMYFDIVRYTKNSALLLQPAIRTYAVATNKITAEVLECIEKETGIDIGVVSDIFKHVNFDANPHWLDSPEYAEAMAKIEEIKTPRSQKTNWLRLRHLIKEMFTTDYINYLNICTKKLAYFLKEYDLESNVPSYETVFVKSIYDIIKPQYKGKYSEVVINAKYVTENCTNQNEFQDRLYKAVLDAQAINQMRVSLLLPAGRKPQRYTLHVKLDGLEEDLKSLAYNVMSKATSYLKSTYMLPFTFEISQRIFFRDKSRVCYLLL